VEKKKQKKKGGEGLWGVGGLIEEVCENKWLFSPIFQKLKGTRRGHSGGGGGKNKSGEKAQNFFQGEKRGQKTEK